MRLSRRALLAAPLAAPAIARAQDRRRMLMILFRGWEEACDGFRDFFVSRGLPVDLLVRDLAQDLGRAQGFIDEAHAMRPDLVMTASTSIGRGGIWPASRRCSPSSPTLSATASCSRPRGPGGR